MGAHQTWPAAKSPINGHRNGRIIELFLGASPLPCLIAGVYYLEAAFDFAAGPFLLLDIEALLVFHMAVKTVPYPKIVGEWMVIPLILQK